MVNRLEFEASNDGGVVRSLNTTGDDTGDDSDDGGGTSDDHWIYSMRSRNRSKDNSERTGADNTRRDNN